MDLHRRYKKWNMELHLRYTGWNMDLHQRYRGWNMDLHQRYTRWNMDLHRRYKKWNMDLHRRYTGWNIDFHRRYTEQNNMDLHRRHHRTNRLINITETKKPPVRTYFIIILRQRKITRQSQESNLESLVQQETALPPRQATGHESPSQQRQIKLIYQNNLGKVISNSRT